MENKTGYNSIRLTQSHYDSMRQTFKNWATVKRMMAKRKYRWYHYEAVKFHKKHEQLLIHRMRIVAVQTLDGADIWDRPLYNLY